MINIFSVCVLINLEYTSESYKLSCSFHSWIHVIIFFVLWDDKMTRDHLNRFSITFYVSINVGWFPDNQCQTDIPKWLFSWDFWRFLNSCFIKVDHIYHLQTLLIFTSSHSLSLPPLARQKKDPAAAEPDTYAWRLCSFSALRRVCSNNNTTKAKQERFLLYLFDRSRVSPHSVCFSRHLPPSPPPAPSVSQLSIISFCIIVAIRCQGRGKIIPYVS